MKSILILFLFLISTQSFAANENTFQFFGARWAVTFNEKSEPQKVYDLSYPKFLQGLSLGMLDMTESGYAKMYEALEMIDPATLTDKEKTDLAKTKAALAKQQKKDGIISLDVANWWKQVPWKNSSIMQDSEEPQSFLLSDIDFDAVVENSADFHEIMAKLDEVYNESEGSTILKSNFLTQFRWTKKSRGVYELKWLPEGVFSGPKELVDFTNIRKGMRKALAWEMAQNIVKMLVGQIPVPIVAGLLGATIDRFFHFQDLLLETHKSMLLEQLEQSAKNENNPFQALGEEGVKDAAKFTIYSQSSLVDFWKWVKKSAKAYWYEKLAYHSERSDISLGYIVSTGFQAERMNERYANAVNTAGDRYIYMLAHHMPTEKKEPQIAIDFQKPNSIKYKRFGWEMLATTVSFTSYFIPYAGALVRMAFSHFVMDKIDNTRAWEAKLHSIMFEQNWNNASVWNAEMNLLSRQQVNPLELNPAEVKELVQKRRVEFKIPN